MNAYLMGYMGKDASVLQGVSDWWGGLKDKDKNTAIGAGTGLAGGLIFDLLRDKPTWTSPVVGTLGGAAVGRYGPWGAAEPTPATPPATAPKTDTTTYPGVGEGESTFRNSDNEWVIIKEDKVHTIHADTREERVLEKNTPEGQRALQRIGTPAPPPAPAHLADAFMNDRPGDQMGRAEYDQAEARRRDRAVTGSYAGHPNLDHILKPHEGLLGSDTFDGRSKFNRAAQWSRLTGGQNPDRARILSAYDYLRGSHGPMVYGMPPKDAIEQLKKDGYTPELINWLLRMIRSGVISADTGGKSVAGHA